MAVIDRQDVRSANDLSTSCERRKPVTEGGAFAASRIERPPRRVFKTAQPPTPLSVRLSATLPVACTAATIVPNLADDTVAYTSCTFAPLSLFR